MKTIEASPLESIEVRSPLTCEAMKGICAKCYGRNLATGKMTQEEKLSALLLHSQSVSQVHS
jgi:hypothetical protein